VSKCSPRILMEVLRKGTRCLRRTDVLNRGLGPPLSPSRSRLRSDTTSPPLSQDNDTFSYAECRYESICLCPARFRFPSQFHATCA
jgi:hypothetical protein